MKSNFVILALLGLLSFNEVESVSLSKIDNNKPKESNLAKLTSLADKEVEKKKSATKDTKKESKKEEKKDDAKETKKLSKKKEEKKDSKKDEKKVTKKIEKGGKLH